MVTNLYFNNFAASGEQRLLEDLIIESIRIYGQDMWYIPRTAEAQDEIYGESTLISYNAAHMIEMYIKSIDGFSGDGNFLSKFGLEIRDQVIFSVSQRIFSEDVIDYELVEKMTRPREGDLIYFPLNNKVFQITYVNKFEMFYQLGALQTWEMTCELFEYSGETFNTGLEEIDGLYKKFNLNFLTFGVATEGSDYLLDEDGNYIVLEQYDFATIDPNADNDWIQQESDQFVDFTQKDPFSEGAI